jgi:DNA-directed RNA polymerase specialized sigma24 family protein
LTFEEFAQTRLPAVLAFATVLAGQRATAEDLVQEVLIRAHGRWAQIGAMDRPDLYVRKMVVNEFLSWRRRNWRLLPAAHLSPADRSDAEIAEILGCATGTVRAYASRGLAALRVELRPPAPAPVIESKTGEA